MRLVPIGLSCLLLSAAPAAPQSPAVPAPPPPPEPPPSFYETTTVRARPVDTSTAAVDVVPAAEMEAAGARSGSDALRDVSGVNLVSNGGRAGVTNAWIRGADPNFTLVLLDGVPLNDSTELQGGAVNFEEAPAALLDRVEVVRGPLTSFYGTSSLSGVVQLFSPRGGPGPVRAAAGAEAGDASLRRGFGRVSGPAGAGGWSAGASYDAEEHRVADDRFRQLDGFGTADVVLAADARLALSGRLAAGEQDDYPDSSGGPVYGSGETRHTEHDDLAASARLTLGGEPSATQQIFLGVSRRALERTSPAVPPLVPESAESTTFTRLRAAWTRPFARGARTTLDGGVTAEGEWGRNRSVLQLPPALGGDVPGDYDRSRGSGGAFAAVRHERGAVRLEAALRADVASGDSLQLHPHAGVVWRPGRGATRIHVSAGRASKLPSFFALASPPALGGNPALRPERTLGGEAGVDRALSGGRLELGASYFLHEYRDLVDFDFDQFLHVNRARVRTQGAELAIAWKPHPSLDVAAQATYVDARDLSGAPLLFEPRWIGSGRITWRPADRLVLRADLRAVSRYLDRQYPVPDRDAVDGRGLLGAAVSWRAAGGLRLRARADNLTDRAYETQIGFPGPGRSIWAGVGWERP
ncbi:MAG: TonB-dependent receptor [Vicinamibacteria bacterium]